MTLSHEDLATAFLSGKLAELRSLMNMTATEASLFNDWKAKECATIAKAIYHLFHTATCLKDPENKHLSTIQIILRLMELLECPTTSTTAGAFLARQQGPIQKTMSELPPKSQASEHWTCAKYAISDILAVRPPRQNITRTTQQTSWDRQECARPSSISNSSIPAHAPNVAFPVHAHPSLDVHSKIPGRTVIAHKPADSHSPSDDELSEGDGFDTEEDDFDRDSREEDDDDLGDDDRDSEDREIADLFDDMDYDDDDPGSSMDDQTGDEQSSTGSCEDAAPQ